MNLWQRKKVSTGELVGEPAPLPVHLVGLDEATLANLPAAFGPATLGQLHLIDAGFDPVPVADPPPPPPPRPELPKSTVTARVTALGKAADVWALFGAHPELAFQWLSPDWPNVFCDDPGLLAALTAVGLSSDQIAAVTAP